MHVTRFAALFLGSFLIALPVVAQQPTPPAPRDAQAVLVLQRSLAALSGTMTIRDITLTGTVRCIAGSDDESGTVVIKASTSSGSRIDFNLSSGVRSEVHDTTGLAPTGFWSGPDRAPHPIARHNLLASPGYFPEITIARLLGSPNTVVTNLGSETRDGKSVEHISASQKFPQLKPSSASLFERLSEIQIYLDASTHLPVTIAFNIHPDNDASLDIPVELRFSDYRSVNGAQVPFRIQKFINNGLALELQFDSAIFNSGLTEADFKAE